jgi:mono/diheme cytochrome c family protein
VNGQVPGAPVTFDEEGLHKLQRRTVPARAPREQSETVYEGASFAELIRVLEPKPGADLAVVHGRGGYVVAIPIPAIRQHRPILADTSGGRPLAAAGGEAGRIALIWPNIEAPGFDLDPRTRWWWPRDVARVELVPWFKAYGQALRVPPGAGDLARRGADAFATDCIHCHTLRGAGGKRGPDLSGGITPEGREAFVAAVKAHAARVPQLEGTNVARSVGAIAAFLEAVETAGPAQPGDEPEPEQTDPKKPGEQPSGYEHVP